MNLPHAKDAVVEFKKIADYLLNAAHPEGAGKAAFFHDLGFRADDWKVFADELRYLAVQTPVNRCMDTLHGRKYIIDGTISGPGGKCVGVRTVWIVDSENVIPRLITAYPRNLGSIDD